MLQEKDLLKSLAKKKTLKNDKKTKKKDVDSGKENNNNPKLLQEGKNNLGSSERLNTSSPSWDKQVN